VPILAKSSNAAAMIPVLFMNVLFFDCCFNAKNVDFNFLFIAGMLNVCYNGARNKNKNPCP
jgi:hypothetical protein